MAALTALRQLVQPHVQGCPLPMVDDAILQAVIDFCNRSRAYRFRPGDITAVAGTADYAVSDLPEGTEIAWLLAAELDDIPLDILDPASVPLSWETEESISTAAVVVSETEIGLRPVPDAADTLRIRLALRPSANATTYPDALHILYKKQIAAGALAELYGQPNKPWTALELVADARNRFDSGVSDAEYRADRGSSNAPMRTTLCLVGGR